MAQETMEVDLSIGWKSWTDPYDSLNDGVKIAIGILVGIMLIFGPIMILGMLSFEKYGEDPQKRGLLNQIQSQLNWQFIIQYWTTQPVVLWRVFVGPVNSYVFWTWCWIMDGVFVRLFFTGFCIWTYKLLTIVVYKSMLPIVDDLMAMFFLLTSTAVSTILGFVSLCTPMNHLTETRFIGWPGDWMKQTPLDFNLLELIIMSYLVFVIYTNIMIRLEKRKNTVMTVKPINTFNQLKYNNELISPAVYAFFAFLAIIVTVTILLPNYVDEEGMKIYLFLLEDLIHPLVALILYPIVVYASKPDLRQYVFELYANLLPF